MIQILCMICDRNLIQWQHWLYFTTWWVALSTVDSLLIRVFSILIVDCVSIILRLWQDYCTTLAFESKLWDTSILPVTPNLQARLINPCSALRASRDLGLWDAGSHVYVEECLVGSQAQTRVWFRQRGNPHQNGNMSSGRGSRGILLRWLEGMPHT